MWCFVHLAQLRIDIKVTLSEYCKGTAALTVALLQQTVIPHPADIPAISPVTTLRV